LAGKTQISPDRRQLEARSFETAQHIDKQIKDDTINVLQNGTKLGGHHPTGF